MDSSTGVLVKYEGFDDAGNLTDFMYTQNLQFENNAEEVALFSDDYVQTYTEIDN